MIKYKIDRNTSLLLQETEESQQVPLRATSPISLASGGLRLPPFPPRKRDESNPNEAPKNFMNEQEANELKGFIFAQLHEFEESPPFTIQRVCELCLRPREHYHTVGKYLRAVEKSLLVTSSWNAFPPEKDASAPLASISMRYTPLTTSSTPLFSPIPFLHDDARRSKSRSPPPSPLALGVTGPGGAGPAHSPEQKALGLVDELDDPSPGHMSEHPTALSSVTTTTTRSRPFLGSLEQRFTKGGSEGATAQEQDSDAMVVDEVEDKENNG